MTLHRLRLINLQIKQFQRHYSSKQLIKEKVSYTATVNLPKTKFSNKLSAAKRDEIERNLLATNFQKFYSYQEELKDRSDYVLHDGPPYANGDLHMGHSVNKVLKDITIRQNFMNGKRVNYIPGWDCHGLPIEMKALAEGSKASPIEIRSKCLNFAKEALERQKSGFKSWGIAADWDKESSTYQTNRSGYVSNQLKMFKEFFEKGLVFRDLKPVFWSPSSKSALAEAELEYDNNHVSPSVFLKLKIDDKKDTFAIIWTTTPWTLPSNQAVCYNPSLEYSLVHLNGDSSKKYLLATALIQSFSETTGNSVEIIETIQGNSLSGFKYRHPIDKETILPFIPGSHVEDSKGTGLVHTAPAHGPDDFLISLKHKIPIKSLVNEEGRYSSNAPDFLVGKHVIEEGNELVISKLEDDLLFKGTFCHSYPIDWRTKKPVIIRASEQWFMNTDSLKTKAAKEIEKINIYPKVNAEANRKMLMAQVQKRPYWCISRQRSWGVPIPVFYKKDTKEVVFNSEILSRIINLVNEEGSIDFWWSKSSEEIISPELLSQLNISPDNIVKGSDIFDIWFDSGTSWSSVLGPNKIADLYLEGYDQFTGWFQSSLLTSVAQRDCAPYKSLFVHGFTVDEKGLKMSKSLGNVISPLDIIKKYGTDSLRWWVAAHGTQHMSITVSDKLMQQSSESVSKIRSTLRYLNGVVGTRDDNQILDYTKTTFLDKFILNALYKYANDVQNSYNLFEYNRVTSLIQNFVVNEMSSTYLHLIKDSLYCGSDEELHRIKGVLRECYKILNKTIWPITPFLAEESWSHFDSTGPFYKNNVSIESEWENSEAEQIVNEALSLKRRINQTQSTNSWLLKCSVNCSPEEFEKLLKLHTNEGEFISNSELCEILQVGSLRLVTGSESSIDVLVEETPLCPRCRRFGCLQGGVCERCLSVMKSKGF
ncbi:IARS2 family protein [Megaselia abdita]